ncbi:metal-dependent hydrolase [Solihabitans fulvus]|uniref:Metal-dependent hydrolase n=1 Tax=Solihabitans fulvus TaxID=1892852 RepID=A0A5B2XTP5_9PSEU|nr:metal-dependent hydrolase [Solihabitans fulvus]KAA2266535.1 metal-dependent hydrolase [Solihabitans fulvus]
MCTGPTHALQGAIVGLAVTAAVPTIVGYTPTVPAILLGTVLTAGGALLPDLDMPRSTASKSVGPITDVISDGVQGLSRITFRLTASRADRAHMKGTHRGLTHTLVAAAALGAGFTWLTGLGRIAALATVFLVSFVALRGLPPVEKNFTDLITAAAITGGAWWVLTTQPVPAWWIGGAIGVGCLTHQLGDATTTHGVPLLWPLPLAGQQWRGLGIPRFMRFHTGGPFESRVLPWLLGAGLAALLVGLIPGAWAACGHVVQSALHHNS